MHFDGSGFTSVHFDGSDFTLGAERQAPDAEAPAEHDKDVQPAESDVSGRPRAVIITMPGDEVALAVELPHHPPEGQGPSTTSIDAPDAASTSSSRRAAASAGALSASASGSQSGRQLGASAPGSMHVGDSRAAEGDARGGMWSWRRNSHAARGPRGPSSSGSGSTHVAALNFLRLFRLPTRTVVDTLPT